MEIRFRPNLHFFFFMRTKVLFLSLALIAAIAIGLGFRSQTNSTSYHKHFNNSITELQSKFDLVLTQLQFSKSIADTTALVQQLHALRVQVKALDFWLRYLEPVSYKKINGPLPVEWETEVFEKFEKPYRREGAGLTLAELYLQEENSGHDSIIHLLQSSSRALNVYLHDSIQKQLQNPEHFYFCNRLFLLNLAAIYTTGFETPNSERIIPELRLLLNYTENIYSFYNTENPQLALSAEYLKLYAGMRQFVNEQSTDPEKFEHFVFIRDFVNPLFAINQQHISTYKLRSKSLVDYSLNNRSTSIFSKDLYYAQNIKGIYSRISSHEIQQQIWELGKKLFYDPLLSGNNERSCASCHKADQHFTDTLVATNLQFNGSKSLPRNTPSLLNSNFNHLLMQDGSINTLLEQSKAVITNTLEMACAEKDILKKILSCQDYKTQLKKLLPYTPQSPEISLEHITSALTSYYGSFSNGLANFDKAMNKQTALSASAERGFNLFMSKAQCATCHFAPHFNGVKPPYVGSEFEVIGVPIDTLFSGLSTDKGRYAVNPATETLNAFRTGTLKNISKTSPYMHNGVFKTLQQVVDFYDAGGGQGRGLKVDNQTLSADSLHLTPTEKQDLINFMQALTEDIPNSAQPQQLPASKLRALANRKVGGNY